MQLSKPPATHNPFCTCTGIILVNVDHDPILTEPPNKNHPAATKQLSSLRHGEPGDDVRTRRGKLNGPGDPMPERQVERD